MQIIYKKSFHKFLAMLLALVLVFGGAHIPGILSITAKAAPNGYNAHDLEKVTAFLNQSNGTQTNAEILSWDINDPSSWPETNISWVEINDELCLQEFVLQDKGLHGTLDLSGCTMLIYVDCTGNELTAIDVSDCTILIHVYCYNNQLTTLDISSCVDLVKLYCYGNQLTELDVSGYASLMELYCQENALTTLDVSSCAALKDLKTHRNTLDNLDVLKGLSLENFSFSQDGESFDIHKSGQYEITVRSVGDGFASSSWGGTEVWFFIDADAITNFVDFYDLVGLGGTYSKSTPGMHGAASENKKMSVTAVFNGTYSVSGKITGSDTGAGLAATVQLKNENNQNHGAAVTADADGTYEIPYAPIGTGYTINVTMSGYESGTTASFDVSDANIIDKDLILTKLPPLLSNGSASSVTETTADINFTSNEAGTTYYLIYKAADTAPGAATIVAQGTAAATAAIDGANAVSVSGLTDATDYIAYVIVKGSAVNASNVLDIAFTTVAKRDPTYIITIPATIDLGTLTRMDVSATDAAAIKEQAFNITASDVQNLFDNKKVVVRIAADSLALTEASGTAVLPFSVYTSGNSSALTGVNDVFAQFGSNGSHSGKITIDQRQITKTGNYSGTLTFNVSVEN